MESLGQQEFTPSPGQQASVALAPSAGPASGTNPQALEALVTHISRNPGFPAFMANIQELLAFRQNPYYTVHDISQIILRDFALTTQILKVVNSIHFQTYQRQVQTISSAVLLLGFDYVRDLALGLKLFENFQKSGPLHQVKQLIFSSFLTAIYSQELAGHDRQLKDEEVFLTALLFNLGELIVAYYFPEKYREMLALVETGKVTKSMAAQQVLQVTLEDLGLAILKTWNFPAPLINKLATLRLVSKAGPGPEAKLRKIIDGAARFSRGLINQNLTGPELERQKEKLCQSLGLKPELFADSLTASVSRFQELAKILKVNLKDLGFTLAPAPGETPKAPAAGDQAPAKPAKTAAPPLSPEDQEVQNLRFLYQVMEEINQALVDKAPINQVISLVMEGIFRGIGFDRVILCLVNPQRTMVLGRFGLGEQADHLIKLLRLPLNSKKNALALSLAERREVLACPQSRLADRQLMEDGFWLASNCQTFLVTPIFVDQAPIGLLYMDRCTAKASISELDRHRVRTFRDLAILALRMSTGTNAGA